MDEPYIGEIRLTSFPYAPKGWAFCAGQALPIAQNQALFALLGIQFGGDGRTTFNLPDLRGRLPVGSGPLSGGDNYTQGSTGGSEQVALTQAQIPVHQHAYSGALQTSGAAEQVSPAGNLLAAGGFAQYVGGAVNTAMGPTLAGLTTAVGSSQGHENRQPYTAVNYVIALQGLFPPRQ